LNQDKSFEVRGKTFVLKGW